MTEETEVLVVGAGPVGLTLAAGLLLRGIRVRIIDKSERANPHSKAIVLWPRSLEALDTLGIGEDIHAAGNKIWGSNNYTGRRRIANFRMKPLTGTRYPGGISLPQSRTEEFIRGAVEQLGGRIEFGKGLVSLRQDDDGAVAELEDGETVRANWVVGADGAHSTTRGQLGVTFEGLSYPQTFLLVDGEYETDCLHDETYYMLSDQGVVVVVGLPGGLYRCFASVPPGQEITDVEETISKIAAERSPVPVKLVKAHGSGVFHIHARIVDRMRVGHALLAGDAAHIHSPAGGYGLNIGIEDAHSLAWRLAGVLRGNVSPIELDSWEKERLGVAKAIIAETDKQTKMWMMTGWQRVRRDLGIQFIKRTGIAARVIPRKMAQLDVVLPTPGDAVGKLKPGARLPSEPLGGDRHLRDLLRGGKQLVLAFTDTPAPVLTALDLPANPGAAGLRVAVVAPTATDAGHDGAELVRDTEDRVRRLVGAPKDAVYLVRPDGIIAAGALASDATALARLRTRIGELCALDAQQS